MNAKVKQLSDFDDPNAQVTGKKRYFIFDSQIFQKKKWMSIYFQVRFKTMTNKNDK